MRKNRRGDEEGLITRWRVKHPMRNFFFFLSSKSLRCKPNHAYRGKAKGSRFKTELAQLKGTSVKGDTLGAKKERRYEFFIISYA